MISGEIELNLPKFAQKLEAKFGDDSRVVKRDTVINELL